MGRRRALGLRKKAREIPLAARSAISAWGAIYDRREREYLFMDEEGLAHCQRLCGRVLRRSEVPIEARPQMMSLGIWCEDLVVPVGDSEERGAFWFLTDEALLSARAHMTAWPPNNGRGACSYDAHRKLYLLHKEYMPGSIELINDDLGRECRSVRRPRPALAFATLQGLYRWLPHSLRVIPGSAVPAALFSSCINFGGISWHSSLVCPTEEVGGFYSEQEQVEELRAILAEPGKVARAKQAMETRRFGLSEEELRAI